MKRQLVPAALAALLGAGCQDVVSAPTTCPEFCPPGQIEVRDTILANSVEPVGSYGGYKLPHEAREIQIVGPGGPAEARALIEFNAFSETYSGADTSVKNTILQTDSIRITVHIARRTPGSRGIVLALHEIPFHLDSTATYAALAPYFDDSTLVATLAVPDSLRSGLVSATAPASRLRYFLRDSLTGRIGVRIRSLEPAFVSLADSDTVVTARVTRFVQLDSSSGTTRVTRSDSRVVFFRTFVVDPARLPAPEGLIVGGVTAARAFIRLTIPARILDSTQVVRGTLLLPQARPAFGAPGDTFRLRAHALGADFGPKSPLIAPEDDSTSAGSARIAAKSTDTAVVDITNVLRAWRGNPSLPHTIMLRVVPEATSINQFEVPGRQTGLEPVLRITYGLPFRVVGR